MFYARKPDFLNPETLATVMRDSSGYVMLAFILFSVFRNFTLLPSTVLVITGTLLFPERLGLVFSISLVGVVISAALIYFLFEFLGLDTFFKRRYPERVRWLERQLQQRGIWIVMAWSAFPFVPTDVICYVAGTLRMNFTRFALGVALGELPLIIFYVLVVDSASSSLGLFGLAG